MKVRSDQVVVYVVRQAAENAHEILQLRRATGKYLAGHWSFAGGGIEPGESATQAALRELHEETGLFPREMSVLSFVDTFYVRQFDTVWHRIGFLGCVDRLAEIQLNDEHTESRWIVRRDIRRCVLWPGERRALAEIFSDHLNPARQDHPSRALLRIDLNTLERPA